MEIKNILTPKRKSTLKLWIALVILVGVVTSGVAFLGQHKTTLTYCITREDQVLMDMEAMRIIDQNVASYSAGLSKKWKEEYYSTKVVMLSPLPDSTK